MSGPHKKGGHEEGGGHAPMWIVSFADMVILLMSFFVLLLCQGSQKSSVDEDLLKILASVKVSFGYKPKIDSKDPLDIAVMQLLAQKQKGGFQHSAQRWRTPTIKGAPAKDPETWVKAQSPVGKPFRFPRDSAVLSRSAKANIEEIAEVVRHHFRIIVIQGHCSSEEAENDSEDGDDLAYRRALAVKHALREYGVAASRLRIVSCGSHETLRDLKSPDRQLVIVTLGAYFLPTDKDVVDEGSLSSEEAKGDAKPSGHGGH